MLTNSIIKLRAVEPEDLDLLYEWENSSQLWEHGNTLAPYSKNTLRRYINEIQHTDIYESKQLRLMIDLTEKNITIGTIDIFDLDVRNAKAGVGVLIDEKYRNNSYAYQSLELIREYAFGFLRLKQLYAYISTDNTASLRLFEKAEYICSGVLRSWILKDKQFKNVQLVQLINNEQ